MTMPSSGALNMGGTSSPVSVNFELGKASPYQQTVSMNDAAVRSLAGVGGSGTSWSMNSLYGKSSIVINSSITCDAQARDYGPPPCYIHFINDGTITYEDPALSSGSANWATPTTAGVGSSYWIKVTRTSGITPSGMTSGTIYALSISPSMYISAVFSGQTRTSNGTIDIYSDSGGTTRVGGGTYGMVSQWY